MNARYPATVLAICFVVIQLTSCSADTASAQRTMLQDQLMLVFPEGSAGSDSALRQAGLYVREKRTPSQNGLCSLVSATDSVHGQLGDQLSMVRDNLYAMPAPEGTDGLQRLSEQIEQVEDLLPGVGLALGAEGVRHWVRYDQLAQVAEPGSSSQHLLQAVGKLREDQTGWPVFVEQQTDVGGCTHPGNLIEPLQEMRVTWSRSPACLTELLFPVVEQAIFQAVESTCFCESKDETAAAMNRLAEELEEFPSPQAAGAAAEARAIGRRPTTQFQCSASG